MLGIGLKYLRKPVILLKYFISGVHPPTPRGGSVRERTTSPSGPGPPQISLKTSFFGAPGGANSKDTVSIRLPSLSEHFCTFLCAEHS